MKQYGIRLRTQDDMSYSEFCSLLSGIMPDTPLGQIVRVRAEKDPEVIKRFTKEQQRIRSEWLLRKVKKIDENKEQYVAYWSGIQKWAKAAFGKQK